MKAIVPFGRTMDNAKTVHAARVASPSKFARALPTGDGGVPADASRKGGFAMMWAKLPDSRRSGRFKRSPIITETRPLRLLNSILSVAYRTREGCDSIPVT